MQGIGAERKRQVSKPQCLALPSSLPTLSQGPSGNKNHISKLLQPNSLLLVRVKTFGPFLLRSCSKLV